MIFRKVGGKEVPDYVLHCAEQKVKFPNCRVHIGCDSIVTAGRTWFITVIAFRYENAGAHFIYNKMSLEPFRLENGKPDISTRLLKEADLTYTLAEELVSRKIFTREEITLEFDFNNIKVTKSTPLISQAATWTKSLGYDVYLKAELQVACKAADQICQSC